MSDAVIDEIDSYLRDYRKLEEALRKKLKGQISRRAEEVKMGFPKMEDDDTVRIAVSELNSYPDSVFDALCRLETLSVLRQIEDSLDNLLMDD